MPKKFSKASLNKHNDETLELMCLEHFGTPLPAGLEKAEKIEMLLEMHKQAEADKQDLTTTEAADTAAVEKKQDEHVYVRIANQEGVCGDQPVFLSVNGFPVLIHREKWVKLRRFFLPALQYAQETHFYQSDDGTKTQKDMPRYNVQYRTLDQGVPDDADVMDII